LGFALPPRLPASPFLQTTKQSVPDRPKNCLRLA
jgi:hypothetical protein